MHLRRLIRAVRRGVRRRALLQGSAVALIALFSSAVALILLYPLVYDQALLLYVAVSAALVITAAATFHYVIRPLRRQISDEQIAMYIEEQAPGLEDRLNSAVEAKAQHVAGADIMLSGLLADTARMIRGIVPGDLVRKVRARIMAGAGTVLAALLLVFGVMNLDKVRLVASSSLAAVRPLMTIVPGNVEIEKGESQSVVAELREGTSDAVYLVYQEEGKDWVRKAMEPGSEGTAFLAEFSSIQAPIDYYVEAGKHRSALFRIAVYEFPAVDQIDLAYHYPSHIALPPVVEADAGDIHGLKGSEVQLTVRTTGVPVQAEMVLESGGTIALKAQSEGQFTGRITLEEEDLYTLRLTDANGKRNQFPVQYAIMPVPDRAPHITMHDPGRDVRANAIEEVLIAADVDDDYGVKDFQLVFFVGGGAEQSVALLDQPAGLHGAGEHLLFLEDYSLQPGDVITYYLEAQDATQRAVTDMYFIEVIPFDQTYTQVSAAAGGQGGAQQSGMVVSQQEIIAATWRLMRERDTHEDYAGALQALAGAQANLKRSIEERIQSTAFSLELRGNEMLQQTVHYLQEAVGSMAKAVEALEEDRLREALPPERVALTALLRADAQNKENQVAQQQQRSGGGGASATEERMSELMDLELDISKDKYEVQQQRAQETQAIDEALRQVKDLARRQQDLADLQRPQDLQGEDRKRFVDKLRRDQEEVRTQLEQVAQRMQAGRQEDAQGRMASALRNMREADRALRRDNLDEAMQRQRQALQDLEQLQPDMQRAARGSRREQLRALTEDLEDLAARERVFAQDLDTVMAQGTRPDEEAMRRLDEDRLAQMDALHQAVEEAMRMEAQSQDPEMTANLRNLVQQMQRDDLAGDMATSYRALRNGWLDSARRLEDEILNDLRGLEAVRRALAASLPVTEEEALAAALREVQALQDQLRALESDAERLRASDPQDDNRSLEARLRSQLGRAQAQLQELMGRGSDATAQALAGVQNALSRADHTGVLLDEESANAFFERDVYDALNQLEAQIARALDLVQMEARLYGSRRGEVPTEYSSIVEKYYESLSRQ